MAQIDRSAKKRLNNNTRKKSSFFTVACKYNNAALFWNRWHPTRGHCKNCQRYYQIVNDDWLFDNTKQCILSIYDIWYILSIYDESSLDWRNDQRKVNDTSSHLDDRKAWDIIEIFCKVNELTLLTYIIDL